MVATRSRFRTSFTLDVPRSPAGTACARLPPGPEASRLDDPQPSAADRSPARDVAPRGEPLDDAAFAELLQRLGDARPFSRAEEWVAGPDWAAFKRAFKQAEATLDEVRLARLLPLIDGLHLIDAPWRGRPAAGPAAGHATEPDAAPDRGATWPWQPGGDATAGYLKRRARRLLRRLAADAPAAYVPLAAAVLTGVPDGPGRLDLHRRWLAADVLFGGATRVSQLRHGRGWYVAHGRAGRLAREERAPVAWGTSPGDLAAVYAAPDSPLEAREMALRALRAGGHPLPALDPDLLGVLLDSSSPLLVFVARDDALARLQAGAPVPAGVAARACILGNAAQQAAFPATGDPEWRSAVAAALLEWLFASRSPAWPAWRTDFRPDPVASHAGSRRRDAVVRILGDALSGALPASLIRPRVGAMLAEPALAGLVWAAIAHERPDRAAEWLGVLARVPESDRTRFVDALGDVVAGWQPPLDAFQKLVAPGANSFSVPMPDENKAELVARWDVAARTDVATDVLERYWQDALLQLRGPVAGVVAARGQQIGIGRVRWLLGNTGAGATLDRVLAERPAFLLRWQADPIVADRVRPEQATAAVIRAGFGSIDGAVRAWPVRNLGEVLLRAWVRAGTPKALLATADVAVGSRWKRIAPVLFAEVSNGDNPNAFFLAAWERVLAEPEGALATRLPADRRAVAGFLAVPALPVERVSHPGLEPLALRWLAANPEVPRDSARLFALATSGLAGIRGWALAHLRAVGAGDAFLLRLLESRQPEAMAVAREMALDPARAEPLGLAVAAIDSPDPQARALGWEVATRRGDVAPADLVARLAEHPDPGVQGEVARLATEHGIPLPPAFARAVARGRNRARRAKSVVQRSAAGALDAPTLLEIARGATPQDAEWALAELARRVLAGETIDGVAIDGVAGV